MKIKFILLLAAVLTIASAACADPKVPAPVMPSDQVLPGMKGYGLTVMSGTEPKQFGIEIIGTLRKANSGGDIILGRMIGEDVEHTGPAAGMSGSPIYIDGKLIGALAWAWPLSKDPICGITPIGDMLSIKANKAVEAADAGTEPAPFRSVIAAAAGTLPPQAAYALNSPGTTPAVPFDLPALGAGELRPVATPVSASGFTESSRAMLKRLFENNFASPVTIAGGVTGGAGDYAPDPSADELRPGSVLTVPLVWGDFEVAVLGTVSYRDGDTVLAFGHPMFNEGPLSMPMAGGRVHHIMAKGTIDEAVYGALQFKHSTEQALFEGIKRYAAERRAR